MKIYTLGEVDADNMLIHRGVKDRDEEEKLQMPNQIHTCNTFQFCNLISDDDEVKLLYLYEQTISLNDIQFIVSEQKYFIFV